MVGSDISYDFIRRAGMVENHHDINNDNKQCKALFLFTGYGHF